MYNVHLHYNGDVDSEYKFLHDAIKAVSAENNHANSLSYNLHCNPRTFRAYLI